MNSIIAVEMADIPLSKTAQSSALSQRQSLFSRISRLGLFILLIVGVVLLGEAGPAAAHAMHDDSLQIKLFGFDLIPMSKSTFYFSVVVLVAVEIIQSGYARKLDMERKAGHSH